MRKDDEKKRIEGERSSAIEQIAMRLDSFGGLRPDMRAEMKEKMTLPELRELDRKLVGVSKMADARTIIVLAVTNARQARNAEEEKRFEHFPPAKVEMTF